MNKRMMRQAQERQSRLAKIREEIASTRTEAASGGGAVRAVVIGGTKIESIEINPEVVDSEDVEMLQDLIIAAVNEAMEQAQSAAAGKMGVLTGGLNIPGLM